jgi:hypothetical protein
MDYDHHETFHRKFLATHLRDALITAGFTVQPARRDVEEEVWKRGVEGTKFQIAVYTTIVGDQVRSVGKDAIRVVGLYENGGQVKGKLKSRSVHRTGKVEDIKERTIQRARETWKECKSHGNCHCGAPLLVSKKGNAYCADLCWKN